MAQPGMLRRPVGLLPTVVERATRAGVRPEQSADGPAIAATVAPMAVTPMWVAHGIVVGEVAAGMPFGQVVAEIPTSESAATSECANIPEVERRSIVTSHRGRALARKQVTHYKCLCCATLVPNSEEKCTSCSFERPPASGLSTSQRESKRAAARSNTKRGRDLNKLMVGTEQIGLQVAVSSAFEEVWQLQREKKRQKQRCGADVE